MRSCTPAGGSDIEFTPIDYPIKATLLKKGKYMPPVVVAIILRSPPQLLAVAVMGSWYIDATLVMAGSSGIYAPGRLGPDHGRVWIS